LVNCLTQAAKRCSKTQIRFGIQFSRINCSGFNPGVISYQILIHLTTSKFWKIQ